MSSTTISLEKSAYELLRARKRPDESFSEEVVRLLGEAGPSLKGFLDIVPEEDGDAVARAMEAIRTEDAEAAKGTPKSPRHRGRRA